MTVTKWDDFRRDCDKGKSSGEPCKVRKSSEIKETVGEQILSPNLEVGNELRPGDKGRGAS